MTALTARRVGTQPTPASDTYVCQRCGITRTTKPGRASTYCRDCRDVAPDMCTETEQ